MPTPVLQFKQTLPAQGVDVRVVGATVSVRLANVMFPAPRPATRPQE